MRRRIAACVTLAGIVFSGMSPALANSPTVPEYADVLARTIERDVPERIDPWAVAEDEAVTRPVDGWARPDVISPAREAKLILERIRAEAASISVAPTVSTSWGYGRCPSIPPHVTMCESHQNYDAENAYSTASGCYQIIDSSWAGFGGYSHASDAPPAVQDEKAAQMWAGGAGASHWAACL